MVTRFTRILVSFCAVVLFTIVCAGAQSVGDIRYGSESVDIKIYFPYDEAYVDSSYMNNGRILSVVDSLLRDSVYIESLRTIEVIAQSSPEGTIAYNTKLSERRRECLEEYFRANYPEVDSTLWHFVAVAENWDEFRRHLVEDESLPERERIMAIVDSDRDLDAKERLLKAMDGGEPWGYIKEYILPYQRYGASMLFIPKVFESMGLAKVVENNSVSVPALTSQVECREFEIKEPVASPSAIIAIKTNLLWDAVTIVNLGIEVPIGNRVSVVGEVVYPWWRSWANDFTMQMESYHGEVKYWFGDREKYEKLTGFSAGVYGGWGRYDIQPFTSEGVQGEFWDVGLEVGYAHKIAGSLHLEYTIGFGYTSTTYQDYKMAYGTEEYGDIKVIPYPWITNSMQTVLPTRCGVSLVWVIKGGKGGRE